MARSRAVSIEQFRRATKRKILADRLGEAATLQRRHPELPILSSLTDVLQALNHAEPAPIGLLRMLIGELQQPGRLRIVDDLLLWSFIPIIQHQLERKQCLSTDHDTLQQCWVSLFETLTTLPVHLMDAAAIIPAIKVDVHEGFISVLAQERKQRYVQRWYYQRVRPLGPDGMGARRKYRPCWETFSPDERSTAQNQVRFLCGRDVMADPRLDVWMATVIDGEPVEHYVRRRHRTNSDEEVKRFRARVRKHKGRINLAMRAAINCDPMVANQDALQQEMDLHSQVAWNGCARTEMPEYS